MDAKTSIKKYQKKSSADNDKAMAKLNNKNKKKKQRKSAIKEDAKDSDRSADALEIEGVRALDQAGFESDSSNQGRSEKPLDTPVSKEYDKRTVTNDIKQDRKPAVASPASPAINSLSESMTNMQVMSKPKSSNSKGSKSKGSKSGNQTGAKNMKKNNSTNDLKKMNNKTEQRSTESLRWENAVSDSDEEKERIRMYKMNRRKRYLAFAQSQGLGWTSKYHSNGSPLSEDSGIDTQEKQLSLSDTHSSPVAITDFSSLKQLGPSQALTSNNFVEC